MIRLILIASTIIITSSCAKKDASQPKTLSDYNNILAEKKNELNKLEEEISELTDIIAELDPSLQEKSKLVDTSIVRPGEFTRFINIQGAVETEDPVNAVSEIVGRIVNLYFKEGQSIQKGQLVATIDSESIEKQIDEIETSLELARDVYERQERLWSQNIGSEIQYLQAKNNVERLEKSLETIRLQLSKSEIYAPISGVVDMVMTKQGEVVSPGVPIIQILNTYNLKVTTDLPENYLKIVRRGQLVDLNFPSIDVTTTGRIILLGSKIDPANRTLELEIRPSIRHELFKPNMLAEIKVQELNKSDVFSIPLEYILQEVNGTEFIYTAEVDENGSYRAQKKYVTTGEADEGVVIIEEGLTAGDAVIFKGSRNVSDRQLLEFSN